MLNPVVVAVIVMTALCLFKVNVLIAIMISAMVGGVVGGLGFTETVGILIGGMGNNGETALSYILLGTLAAAISQTSIVELLAVKLSKGLKNKKILFVLIIAFLGCFSQNAIPIHISYIPILIPPLLVVMNNMKLDRRAMACGLTFSVKWPYVAIPAGFGLIFHGIIAKAMEQNGLPFETTNVWKAMLIPGCGMILGLFIAVFFSYRKPREYKATDTVVHTGEDANFGIREVFTIIAIVAAFVIQILTGSMPLGGLAGILILMVTRVIKIKEVDDVIAQGIKLMGFIAFVMLVAAGFAEVIKATNGVDALVTASASLIGGSKLIGAIIMLLIGLGITMGIGTSFGTVPIIATIYVPLGVKLGFSPMAIACLLGVAGALGDAGSPASDSTLGPTAGLNVDGQHDHIWDTCVPTFMHYNISLIIFGTIAAMIL
ncbi:sodium:proton antiporter [Treponema phagedenis]|uniref:Sodium:proton antiporter n=1 Tax=Treponema phagedenis TaxID=162 RepID=A0A0B7GRR7_TREPH|nr:Na+/H+ antiporter NhaC family protein [Treponema phagedenis]EFW37441.1 Na+/H+ antiporter family protein [Treponema phagedenis F0421]NVP24796.1 sodium:proton antiporter [Treponema phagedenis]QEJ95905.1 sodium:proton antiporter [Treponema phagedenis]QEJ98909.1 sodium:proton antiporter [Treponema phagedenis]QEK00398.1 sodium:proton antiporter [Treponema phagedenis]